MGTVVQTGIQGMAIQFRFIEAIINLQSARYARCNIIKTCTDV